MDPVEKDRTKEIVRALCKTDSDLLLLEEYTKIIIEKTRKIFLDKIDNAIDEAKYGM